MKSKTAKKKNVLIAQNPLSRSKRESKKVLIALSGGIDSAVSAYLLQKQGYQVEAAFMKNWSSTEGLLKHDCPWLVDRQDALRVAAFLRIPLHTLDFEKQYQNTVMKYFFQEYKKGRTPNPDVMCNKEIKFKLLYNWAMHRGFGYLATGHYAKIRKVGGREVASSRGTYQPTSLPPYCLERSSDEFKDQTYFIYNIKSNQLPHLLFPVGGMKKSAVRSLAHKLKLPNAEKRESMGLCFVGKIRLKDFLKQKLREKPGEIIDVSLRGARALSGDAAIYHKDKIASTSAKATADRSDATAMTQKVIGRHQGLHNYTIGQRQGIKVGAAGPYYVVKKDLKHNRLYVTNNPDDAQLLTSEVQIHSVNWLDPKIESTLVRTAADYKKTAQLRAVSDGFTQRVKSRFLTVNTSISELKKLSSGGTEGSRTPETDLSGIGSYPEQAHLKLLYHDRQNEIKLFGRYRHQGDLVSLTISKVKKDLYRAVFEHPQKAVASGQSLVLYDGKTCVGGGVIV